MSEAPTPPPPPPESPGPGYYPVTTPSATLPTHEYASLSLGLGIVGLLGGFFCIGLLAAPFAIGFGVSARRSIRREPDRWRGDGMALAGIILGVIGTVALVLVVLGLVAIAVMIMTGNIHTVSSGGVSA